MSVDYKAGSPLQLDLEGIHRCTNVGEGVATASGEAGGGGHKRNMVVESLLQIRMENTEHGLSGMQQFKGKDSVYGRVRGTSSPE